MFNMPTTNVSPAHLAASSPECAADGTRPTLCDPEQVRIRQLMELERLRTAGMETVGRISDWLDGGMDGGEARILAGRTGMITQFVRTTRAIRQIMVLEQELVGLRPAPDRDAVPEPRVETQGERRGDGLALRENLFDYDNGPMDQVVAHIRTVLAVAAPQDDPFAPAVRRAGVDGDERRDAPAGEDFRAEVVEVEAVAAARRAVARPGRAAAGVMADAGISMPVNGRVDGPAVGRRGRDPPG
jgi:hypothetical protein